MTENTKIYDQFVLEYLSQNSYEYKKIIKYIIQKSHYKNVKKIIEQNTDIYSVFHYDSTRFLGEIDNISYWIVREISSEQNAVINSNKDIVIPFGNYLIDTIMDKKFINAYNFGKYKPENDILFDLKGNIVKGKIIDNSERQNNIELVYNTTQNLINEIRKNEDNNNDILKYTIDFIDDNKNVAAENTKKLENCSIPHSIFDYKKTIFFTDSNKRFFALQQKDSEKWGLINAKGELIVPFIYDDIAGFVVGEGDYILMKADNKYGLLDCMGQVAVKPISDNCISFYDGLAIIEQDKKFGYIDTSGNIVIPVIYDKAEIFQWGKAKVELNDEKFYINRKGERIE